MDFSKIKKLVIPEGDVQQIKDINGNLLWEKPPLFINQIPKSIGTDGKPYNGGLGYKAKTYLHTGDGGERNDTSGTVTGFIKAKAKDVIRIWEFLWGGPNASSMNSIAVYDSNFKFLGSTTWKGSNSGTGAGTAIEFSTSTLGGVWLRNATLTLIDNPNIAYIRVCSRGDNGGNIPNGANAIITVNEEIL